MNTRIITFIIGWILRIEAVFMFPALAISIFYSEKKSITAFIGTIVIIFITSELLLFNKPKETHFFAREGFVVVALCWISMSFFGSLPFFLSTEIPSFVDCFFETVSGFTTTGSSILSNIEIIDKGLLYWRSFTHWLGGMGVLVFLLAIKPISEEMGHSVHILRAESPGPVVGKLVPKIQKTAKILYIIYIFLTVLEFVMLIIGGMPAFDSITTAFATAGTGGFSIKNQSMAAYSSYYLQNVVSIFMILFGINFNVFYLLILGEISSALKYEELRVYLGIMFSAVIIITINIRSYYSGWLEALHHAVFQSASIMTTTGFATVDFNLWPQFSKYILIVLMFVGACAGSTGGGIKISRIIILFKALKIEIEKMLHPNLIKVVKIDKKTVSTDVIKTVDVYMFTYSLIVIASILLITVDNFSFETTVTAVISCINNVGPGLDMVGPVGNYSKFSDFSKIILSLNMLIGRLEIFPMLMIFFPSTWNKKYHKFKHSNINLN